MTQLIEQYIDSLLQDPHAPPPHEMDAGTAAFVRSMIAAGNAKPTAVVRARMWQRALDATKSANGHQNHVSNLLHSTNGYHSSMPLNRISLVTKQTVDMTRFRGILTLAAACALVLFGMALLSLIGAPGGMPNATGNSGSVTPTETPTPLASGTPIPTVPASLEAPVIIEALAYANVRVEPDTQSTLLGEIHNGELYPATGRYFDWIQFQFDQATRGWVFNELVNVTGDLNSLPEISSAAPTGMPTPEPTLIATIPGTRLPSNLAAIMNDLQSLTGNPDAGRASFEAMACSACHDNETISTLADTLWQNAEDTIRRLPQFSGYTAEMYIVESIIHPSAYIVPGYANLMPDTYRENLTLQQLADVLTYLRSFALPARTQTSTPISATVVPTLPPSAESTTLPHTVVPPTSSEMALDEQFICPQSQEELAPITDDQQIEVVIDSPVSGDVVSGEVPIIGTVMHPWLWLYQFEYTLDPQQNTPWYGASGAGVEQVSDGVLSVWDSTSVANGVYQLRLSVCLKDNTMLVAQINNLRVENQQSGIGSSEDPANDPLVLTATHIVRQATNIAVRESTSTAVAGRLTPTVIPPAVEPLALTATVIVREATDAAVLESSPTAVPPEVTTYVIQEGDTLLEVALRFDTTLQTLAELNPQIDFSNCDFTRMSGGSNCTILLMVGDMLIVPRYNEGAGVQPILATPTPIPFRTLTATPINEATPTATAA